MKNILIYLLLNTIYVGMVTTSHIASVKFNKWIASLISAITYSFYVIVLMITADKNTMPLSTKMMITFITNVIGVAISKTIIEKMKKDKLWEIDITLKNEFAISLLQDAFNKNDISYNCITTSNGVAITTYCKSQKETEIVKNAILDIKNKNYTIKYCVFEENAKL